MTAPKDKLRELIDMTVLHWCICEPDYYLRGRVDPTCRCDAIAEVAESVAKAERVRFAESVVRGMFPIRPSRGLFAQEGISCVAAIDSLSGTHELLVEMVEDRIAAAIAAAEAEGKQ